MSDEFKGWRKHQRLIEMILERMNKNAQEEFYEKQNEILNELLEKEENE